MKNREKEIHKASISWKDEIIIVKEEKAFVAGAQWADKTMIDRACEWIQCMVLDYMQGDIIDVKWRSMLADFRKAMEN